MELPQDPPPAAEPQPQPQPQPQPEDAAAAAPVEETPEQRELRERAEAEARQRKAEEDERERQRKAEEDERERIRKAEEDERERQRKAEEDERERIRLEEERERKEAEYKRRLQRMVICRICDRELADPKAGFSDCGHAFCAQCLRDYLAVEGEGEGERDGGDRKCVVCEKDKRAIVINADAVAILPRHEFLEQKVIEYHLAEHADDEPVTKAPLCEDCEEREVAVSKCTKCEILLCFDCLKAHKRSKRNAGHSYEEVKAPLSMDARYMGVVMCDVHPSTIADLCCLKCKCVMCVQCISMPNHRGHDITGIVSGAPELTENLTRLLNDLDAEDAPVTDKIKNVRDNIGRVKAKYKQEAQKHKDFYDTLLRYINEKRSEGSKELSKAKHTRKKQLKATLTSLEIVQMTLESGRPSVRKLLEDQGQDTKTMSTARAIRATPLLQHTLDVARQALQPVDDDFSFNVPRSGDETARAIDLGAVVNPQAPVAQGQQ